MSKKACSTCGKKFGSARACRQHEADVHQSKNKILRPPFEGAAGEWVLCSEFQGIKSFGCFECGCNNRWTSAHSFPVYVQGCRECEDESLPRYLWANAGEGGKQAHEDKPHDTKRCGACRAGRCNSTMLPIYIKV